MKKSIKTVIAGLLVVPVLALGINLVGPVSQSAFAGLPECTGTTMKQGIDCIGGDDAKPLFGENGIFTTIINTALFVIGAIAVLMLIYGGIRYTISGGQTQAVTDAKNTILYAIIGIVVAILAYAIVNFVLSSLVTT